MPNIHHFDALVGYFRATGYFKLRPYLSNIAEIRILVGINVDVLLEKYHTIGQQYIIDPQETIDQFISTLKMTYKMLTILKILRMVYCNL